MRSLERRGYAGYSWCILKIAVVISPCRLQLSRLGSRRAPFNEATERLERQ
jgi:hypothetical protein